MSKRVVGFAVLAAFAIAGGVAAQGRIMEMAVQKVIGKYQNASCEQLWQQKGAPKSEEEQRVVQFLRNDPQARTAFINQVAGPISTYQPGAAAA